MYKLKYNGSQFLIKKMAKHSKKVHYNDYTYYTKKIFIIYNNINKIFQNLRLIYAIFFAKVLHI